MSAKPTDSRSEPSGADCSGRRPSVGGGASEAESITTNNHESGMTRSISSTSVNTNQGIQGLATNTNATNSIPNKRGLRKNRRPNISMAQPPMRRRHGLSRTLEEAMAKRSAVIRSQDNPEQATTITDACKRGLRKKTQRPSSINTRAQPPPFRRGLLRTTEERDAKITAAKRIIASRQTVNNINQQGLIQEQVASQSPIQRGIVRTAEEDLEGKIISSSSTKSSRRVHMKFLRNGEHKNRRHGLTLQRMDFQDVRELDESSIVNPEDGSDNLMVDVNATLSAPPIPSVATSLVFPTLIGHHDHVELQIPTLQRHVRQRTQPSPGAVAIPPSSFETSSASASQSDGSLVWDSATPDMIEQHVWEELAEARPVEEDESMQVAIETTVDGTRQNIPIVKLIPLVALGIVLFCGVVIGFICVGGICRDTAPSIEATIQTPSPTAYYRDDVEVDGIKLELTSILGSDYFEMLENEDVGHAVRCRGEALNWILNEDPMQLKATVSSNLHQRFILVLFYIHTTQQGPWKECNPSDPASKSCYRPKGQYSTHVSRNDKHTSKLWGSSWLSADHECQWAGILCGKTRNIIEIELVYNNLNGPLPWELSRLNQLELLDLHRNNLTGSIPPQLGLLDHFMHTLSLASNKLEGHIPTELFSGRYCGNHTPRRIDLGWNLLTATIPSEIGSSTWEWVWLSENFLSGQLPMELFQNGHLKDLFLNGNKKIGGQIPSQIGLLTKLEILKLGETSLGGAIPSEMAHLSNLKMLFLQNSKLGGTVPEKLYTGNSELWDLDVSDCYFSGTISTSIGLWSHLKTFRAANNNFSGLIPEEIGSLTKLRQITLNGNNFSGTIPEPLCTLENAVYLAFLQWELVADCTPDATTGVPLCSLFIHNFLTTYFSLMCYLTSPRT